MTGFNLLQNFVVTNFLHVMKLLYLNRTQNHNLTQITAVFELTYSYVPNESHAHTVVNYILSRHWSFSGLSSNINFEYSAKNDQ